MCEPKPPFGRGYSWDPGLLDRFGSRIFVFPQLTQEDFREIVEIFADQIAKIYRENPGYELVFDPSVLHAVARAADPALGARDLRATFSSMIVARFEFEVIDKLEEDRLTERGRTQLEGRRQQNRL